MLTHAPIVPPEQQSCIHCGECARACPEALNPEALFFALVGDDWPRIGSEHLDGCSECNRCTEVCPSHIPLLDWLRWGKSESRTQVQADAARARFVARDARLAREREARTLRRAATPGTPATPAQTISKSEVLAAIARGRARRKGAVSK